MNRDYDVQLIRKDFPILKKTVYLDNGATTQKPNQVIERLSHFYKHENANVHRGVYKLSQLATEAYEGARTTVSRFINSSYEELIFTRGTTESINLVAFSFVEPLLKEGDEILISHMEHHSNIVPWQLVCERTGAVLKVIPVSDSGEIDKNTFKELLTGKTKILSLTHISNVLGTINPVKEMIETAQKKGVPVLIDGAQAIARTKIDVKELNADFYAFSGHKMYGPTGIGVLYGKRKLLEKMRPYQSGGDMIRRVTLEKTTYNDLPHRFEAGTPNIAGAVGLAAAIDYLNEIGMNNIERYEHELIQYAEKKLNAIKDLHIIGNPGNRAAVLSFTMGDAHPHDIAHELSIQNIAVRAGHHCAQPLMKRFNVPATTRASFGLYNTKEEIDLLAEKLPAIRERFKL
ncbi:MAG: cysteine desulfurase [Spirochaetaceae bacterium]|jgi:cysteine desulfurase/selenocysteine lyase|nr:cysteine desulfurase [Spirochaetaceae bacterium]